MSFELKFWSNKLQNIQASQILITTCPHQSKVVRHQNIGGSILIKYIIF